MAAHAARGALGRRYPVHVTLRFLQHVWNLRARRCAAVIERALRAARRDAFQVVHHSVKGNHVHLLVEAGDAAAPAAGMKGLGVRIARGLNRVMGRRGAVFSDRYHARPLRTPAEVRRALSYVLQNFRRHAAQRGEHLPAGWVDPLSSAEGFDGWVDHPPSRSGPAPHTWLLGAGWRRHGLLRTDEVPGARRSERPRRRSRAVT